MSVKGSRYSDEDRRRAVEEYTRCNSLTEVCESMGLPRKTLAGWLKSDWWKQFTNELRHNTGEPELAGEHGEVAQTKVGRPTSYKPEYAEQATKLCLLGATDQEMGDFFGVTERTIDNWKSDQPEFFQSIRQGKLEADSHVASRLYERAKGYECDEERMVSHGGELVKTTVTKRYPPDFQSAALWLKNRRSRDWRETRHIQVGHPEEQKLVVILPAKLAQKLAASAGESIEIQAIEGEFEPIDDE